jgi:hypothetical protein
VATEKITDDRRDIIRIEATEKPRYPKDIDVGRIVIEEIPEEKEVTKRDVIKREEVKPRHEDMETHYQVEKVPGRQAHEDVVKVGRLDMTEYEKPQREPESIKDRTTTYTGRLGKDLEVTLITPETLYVFLKTS